jgi:RecA-family ATPase
MPEPIIKNGILLDKTMLVIVGPPKSKKTFLAQNLALAIASGKSFANFEITKPKKVLYFLAEGGYYPNRDRLQKMGADFSEKYMENFMLSLFTYLHINHDDAYNTMHNFIKDSGTEVVVIDPLIKFHDVDENSASQLSDVFGRIRGLIRELKVSVILVHHTGKVVSKGGRGSSALVGEYDSCITIKINKDSPNSIKLLSYDTRHTEPPVNNQICFNPDTFWFETDDGILKLLMEHGGSMPKEDFLCSYDKPQSTAYRHILKAEKAGQVKDEGGVLEVVETE